MKRLLIINEQQKKLILTESIINEFTKSIEEGYDYTSKVLKEVNENYKLNFEFLITWGASIGGFISPISEFLQGRFPEMSDLDLSLVLTGIIAVNFIDNRKSVEKVLKLIREEGLSDIFKVGLDKSIELKEVMFKFLESLNITLFKITKMMSYAFIIPILVMLYTMVINKQINESDAKEITLRILGSGLVNVGGIMIKDLISKLITRFKS
jgi:hypothetical protein